MGNVRNLSRLTSILHGQAIEALDLHKQCIKYWDAKVDRELRSCVKVDPDNFSIGAARKAYTPLESRENSTRLFGAWI